jgi:hypothetical protein
MTDELEPTTDASTSDVDTTRVPTAPTAPLTPASRETAPTPVHENGVAWATAEPVVPVGGRPPRRRRMRWAISLAVIAVVIGTTVAVAALITGQASTSTVIGYAPSQTLMYGEVRLDLPGDQRRAVGEFLAKFPGFADQSALDTKLDEVLDELIKGTTGGEQSYTADIKPWFDGELAFSVGPLPPAASLMSDPTATAGKFRALAIVSIKDQSKAQAWFDAAIAKSGATTSSESYNGATLTIIATGQGGPDAALALADGKVALIGDVTSVKAAIDTKGSGGFTAEADPKAAIGSVDGDHIGFMYVALRPLMDWSTQLRDAIPSMPPGSAPVGAPSSAAISDLMLKMLPDWGSFWLRVENDAVVLEATTPKPETQLGPTDNRTSPLVEHIPAGAIFSATSNDYGKTLKQLLDLYRSEPSMKQMVDQVDQALGLVGGADAAIGWAGDVAFVVNVSDGTPEGGVLVAPTDKAAADHLFTSLRSFIALGGSTQGITLRDEDYNGTTITIVDVGDLRALTGASGAATTLPLPAGHLEIAYAVTDKVVVVGTGPAFVKHVLDTTSSTSLASNDRYKKLADRAGTGVGTTFVDLAAIRGLAEKALTDAEPSAMTKYDTDVKPFLDPFDALIASGSVGGDMTRSVIYITVK